MCGILFLALLVLIFTGPIGLFIVAAFALIAFVCMSAAKCR